MHASGLSDVVMMSKGGGREAMHAARLLCIAGWKDSSR